MNRIKHDQSFLYPVFENNRFAFSHINLMPNFFNYSPVVFEGEISKKDKTSIIVKAEIIPIFFWFFVAGILFSWVSYYMDLGGIKDKFINSSFPITPAFISIGILIPYGYYFIKINDVKRIIKTIVQSEEKRAITAHHSP
ncbi:MAG: hypothetical protein FJY07_11515 [Bacteroidetes bacterium]|nr:hypothetical protein [Bacteroidota bacterium]